MLWKTRKFTILKAKPNILEFHNNIKLRMFRDIIVRSETLGNYGLKLLLYNNSSFFPDLLETDYKKLFLISGNS